MVRERAKAFNREAESRRDKSQVLSYWFEPRFERMRSQWSVDVVVSDPVLLNCTPTFGDNGNRRFSLAGREKERDVRAARRVDVMVGVRNGDDGNWELDLKRVRSSNKQATPEAQLPLQSRVWTLRSSKSGSEVKLGGAVSGSSKVTQTRWRAVAEAVS